MDCIGRKLFHYLIDYFTIIINFTKITARNLIIFFFRNISFSL